MIFHLAAWPCYANYGWGVYNPGNMTNIQQAATFDASGIADVSNVAIKVKFMDTGSGNPDDIKMGNSGADAFGSWKFTLDPTTATGTTGGVWTLGGHTCQLWSGGLYKTQTTPTVVL